MTDERNVYRNPQAERAKVLRGRLKPKGQLKTFADVVAEIEALKECLGLA